MISLPTYLDVQVVIISKIILVLDLWYVNKVYQFQLDIILVIGSSMYELDANFGWCTWSWTNSNLFAYAHHFTLVSIISSLHTLPNMCIWVDWDVGSHMYSSDLKVWF
jgi:hypothetical protein